ncbi:DUF4974 domain-containing protein [Pedobacter sp. MC2016-14]|uniref:FecR family protein n=1 Tax=Pedobacter sp. MC2016-14 TaxID=2897327 RepID=UPI001E42A7AC|nr:FecR domain-containing protein [Pedobacter sp. MC2016-14]MCD0488157.1 DUF4974 domain-containing protein [Pedobacter sp. MC2016-14]
MEDKSYRLIVEYFEKTISDDGLTELQEWIEESFENLEQFSETIKILEASKLCFQQPEQIEKSWARVAAHVKREQKPVKKLIQKIQWLAYAAICLIVGTSGFFGYKEIFKKAPVTVEYAEISNPEGQHSKVVLPDNSIVDLAGGSRIRYAKNFLGKKRFIYLDGEAFFDVVHLTKRPFVVKSGTIETVVLGTSFNIKAFATEHKVAVSVKTGKVGVLSAGAGKHGLIKFLLPNEQMDINTTTGLYTFSKIDASAIASWRVNHFVFYNTSLKDIARSLERHYGVKIEFTDPELGNNRLTAKFNNISINEVLSNIIKLSGLAYAQEGNQIFISDNDQKGGRIMK